MNEPDLNLLLALDTFLAEGSVAGAARRLGLSASAMSRTLSRLRTATGDPLLVRAGRNMVLTHYAEAIRERARNAAHEARSLLSPSRAELDLTTLDSVFTLRANDGFVEAFGPALIAAAAREAPGVRLCFMPKPEKGSRHLREGLVDLEIGVLGEMGPEIRLQALFRDSFVAVVRAGHPLVESENITPEQYIAWGHVVTSRRGGIPHGPVDVELAELGLKRNIAAVVPSFPASLRVAQASDLIALVPASFVVSQPAGLLYAFNLPVATRQITVSQMWHPRSEADLAHRWLRQLVLSVCREHAA
ncbi:LysR family transcriptional regulator [Cedecea davisae]|uniref:LysR family transcriptional regulator n=1 Tax=Cedecea davisae TaxID=158484 RepID=A0ABS6DDZ1_9ENTR|nr:LysR family transcriptional regulator [Cedecea davisae]MBU4681015.1 LysR family transcriptional regulator [Cedecea davisae]MBU4685792.1 LysR family transcriptional regulator [Cedecea davisae]